MIKLDKEFAKQLGQLVFWGAFMATAILLISKCALGEEVQIKVTGNAAKINCLDNPQAKGCVGLQQTFDDMREFGEDGHEICPDTLIHYCYIIKDGVLQVKEEF